jgi:hypothetical protein
MNGTVGKWNAEQFDTLKGRNKELDKARGAMHEHIGNDIVETAAQKVRTGCRALR